MGIWIWRAGVLLLVPLLAIVPAHSARAADDEVSRVLDMVLIGEFSSSYSGSKTIVDFSSSSPQVQNYQIIRLGPNKEMSVLEGESGSRAQVVVRDGTSVWNYLPSKNLVVRKNSVSIAKLRERIERDIRLIRQNYWVQVARSTSVLGRKSMVVDFRSKYGGRPSRRLWIDAEKGVFLRSEVYTGNDRLSLLSFYTNIRFDPKVKEEEFQLKVPSETNLKTVEEQDLVQLGALQPRVAFKIQRPTHLPPGFLLADAKLREMGGGVELSLHYTDGLSLLTVSERPAAERPVSKRPGRPVAVGEAQGLLHDFGLVHVLTWYDGRLSFALVGELPEEELLTIARSIQ